MTTDSIQINIQKISESQPLEKSEATFRISRQRRVSPISLVLLVLFWVRTSARWSHNSCSKSKVKLPEAKIDDTLSPIKANNTNSDKNTGPRFHCSSMSRRCLCDTIYPILKFSQLTGIVPLSLKHHRNFEGHKIGDCQLLFKWSSPGAIFNTVFMITFLFTVPFAYGEIRKRMEYVFQGTDLYAFTFQTYALVVQTAIILIASRVRKNKFTKGWQELNQVYHAMCDTADSLPRIKLACYISCLIITIEFIIFFLSTLLSALNSVRANDGILTLFIGVFYIELTTLLPYILSALFFFVCLLIRAHFKEIAAMISTLVESEKQSKRGRLAWQIDSMRVLHEQLCNAVKCFEDFFGVQILVTLCTCCFTVVIGAYAIIIQGEGISSPRSQEVLTAWATQLYCAMVFKLQILVAGQLVTNSANTSAPVLNSIALSELDEQSQRQVLAFLHKISAFPTKMSAVNITTISTTFIASAATNVITYLLVLMQFKLTIENTEAVESSMLGTFGSEVFSRNSTLIISNETNFY